MKALVIIEFDPDEVINQLADISEVDKGEVPNLEEIIKQELGWLAASGIASHEVIMPDNLESNDQKLGNKIRAKIIE